MTQISKFEDSGCESKNELVQKNNPKSANSQILDTLTVANKYLKMDENMMRSDDEADDSNNSQQDNEEKES